MLLLLGALLLGALLLGYLLLSFLLSHLTLLIYGHLYQLKLFKPSQ
jgi:hypothetical protein